MHWYQGLAAKFIILVATLTALTLGAFAWFSYQSYRAVYFENLHNKVEQMAKFIASISADRIFSNDYSTLFTYVKELNSNREIVYAVIIDDQLQPMTAYLDRESGGFKKTVAQLAWRSFAWFVSEPDNIIILRDGGDSPSPLADLLQK